MTTIAYRDGILAADSSVTEGNRFDGTCMKIFHGNGFVAALSGSLSSTAVIDTISIGPDGVIYDKSLLSENDELVVVDDDGEFHMCYKSGVAKWSAPFYVAGSGGTIALGAMAAGATAEEAVLIACKYDIKTCKPVHIARVKD